MFNSIQFKLFNIYGCYGRSWSKYNIQKKNKLTLILTTRKSLSYTTLKCILNFVLPNSMYIVYILFLPFISNNNSNHLKVLLVLTLFHFSLSYLKDKTASRTTLENNVNRVRITIKPKY